MEAPKTSPHDAGGIIDLRKFPVKSAQFPFEWQHPQSDLAKGIDAKIIEKSKTEMSEITRNFTMARQTGCCPTFLSTR
jgi:hypothetical protein